MKPGYNVIVKPWEKGWELHVGDLGVTQIEGDFDLGKASIQVCDYVCGLTDQQCGDFVVRFQEDEA